MWEMLTSRGPYDEHPEWSRPKLRKMIVEERYRMKIPAECHPEYAQLIRECWYSDPNERPSFATIVKRLQIAMGIDPPPLQPQQPLQHTHSTLIAPPAITETNGEKMHYVQQVVVGRGITKMIRQGKDLWCAANAGAIIVLHSNVREIIHVLMMVVFLRSVLVLILITLTGMEPVRNR